MNQLEKDYNYCHNVMKNHSKTFSYAFDFLETEKKSAVWAIYAVCRIIDDSIDRDKDVNQLLKIASDLEGIYNNSLQRYQSDKAIMNAFKDTLNYYAIPHEPLRTLINYVKADLDLKNIPTDAELFNYCYGVAGTVGELLTPILASKNKENNTYAKNAAIELGKALQLTNILRDVGEDFENGRVYLSEEKLNQYIINLQEIYQSGVTQDYIDLWESYAQEATQFYKKAFNGVNYFDTEVQHIIELASLSYFEILEEVRKAHYTLYKKVYVSKVKKMKIYSKMISKYNRSETI
ncbi:phytoene/squalene synthase family protein [Staphylococcus equorum]|uniref:4,4'-diapophytoene synthase n=1 Tax=Staphylococcus equorum TaxID=246432 RepID=A0A9X4LAH8_9STAP|nr:phytoene/squalene synthase family protein [Staphylococcus equorum]MDG0842932.1 phytoene/squalene synthase family protein [Staphylococcus equorum]MDG0859446.1 phytoene/squalene synthase family protein [Staphylococcus equorum]